MTLERVISGGQIGADIAGLRTAKAVGVPTAGFIPRGWRTKDGPKPEFAAMYGLVETGSTHYSDRTRRNVLHSDGTVCFAYNFNSSGTRLTARYCEGLGRPLFPVLLTPPHNALPAWSAAPKWAKFVEWLRLAEIRTLNVAGNGDPYIENVVESYLTAAFLNLREP